LEIGIGILICSWDKTRSGDEFHKLNIASIPFPTDQSDQAVGLRMALPHQPRSESAASAEWCSQLLDGANDVEWPDVGTI